LTVTLLLPTLGVLAAAVAESFDLAKLTFTFDLYVPAWFSLPDCGSVDQRFDLRCSAVDASAAEPCFALKIYE
jgi:hypothetical protein